MKALPTPNLSVLFVILDEYLPNLYLFLYKTEKITDTIYVPTVIIKNKINNGITYNTLK